MSKLKFLTERFLENPNKQAIAFRDEYLSYGELSERIDQARQELHDKKIGAGSVVILLGDYSPSAVAMLIALFDAGVILAPITPDALGNLESSLPQLAADWTIDVQGRKTKYTANLDKADAPELYSSMVKSGSPGLVLFTSGSSGAPKAVVHDFSKLLVKFKKRRNALITINFLLFDHWGGLNTLLHCLSNLCLIVIPRKRTPEAVCELIETHKVELLPTTPSFLSMLVISHANKRYDLTSLKMITYGAEPMPASTLKRLNTLFPNIDIRQTYGMIELGVLRAKTRSPDSLWMKMGGEGYDVRVVDGMLEIKAESAMLGYLNAPSPYTEDGYFMTGDRVEVDGEWMHVLGRESDLINVGGQKAYPAEIESVLFDCEEVDDAVVFADKNPILGHIVATKIVLKPGIDKKEARKSILAACNMALEKFKVPSKISFVSDIPQTGRLKRKRRF